MCFRKIKVDIRSKAAPEQEILSAESVKNPTTAAIQSIKLITQATVFPVLFLIKFLPRVKYNPMFRTNNPKLIRLIISDVLLSSIY